MARGWESKAVESQQADADRPRAVEPPLSDEARQRLQQRRTLELALAQTQAELGAACRAATLELALAQTQAELGAACRAAHRDMLQQRLAAIREAIEALS